MSEEGDHDWRKKNPEVLEHLESPVPDQSMDYSEIFDHLDENGNGVLSKVELRKAVSICDSVDLTNVEMDELMDRLDQDKDGQVTKEEFVELMPKLMAQIQHADIAADREAVVDFLMEEYDKDNSGCINRDELGAFLRDSGDEPMDADEIEDFFTHFDDDGSNTLTRDELKKFLTVAMNQGQKGHQGQDAED